MKRKMLISIALITIMLLNCMLPLFVVNAAEGEEIQLNSKLYNAVKASLTTQGISFKHDDITHTISGLDKSKVTRLDLNEGAISDLTGLDTFTSLTHLDLSGNILTKDSNLSVLNNLTSLNYLDLSTNQLDNVSSIKDLINSLKEKGTIVLSGQTVTIVDSYELSTGEASDNEEKVKFKLPPILELAGYLKSNWKTIETIAQSETSIPPFVLKSDLPMYVTGEDSTVEVTVSSGFGIYEGLVKVTIYIYDDPTEAASANNPNKASENILNGSRFYLYYIAHGDYAQAVSIKDTNLYKAIKEQLTAGQSVNPNLPNYKYSTDAAGNILYETYEYTEIIINDVKYHKLYIANDATKTPVYLYNPVTKSIYTYIDDTTLGFIVNTNVEQITITGSDGTYKAGYKVAHTSAESQENLYEAAYDEAKTFVIDDTILVNKITSLILNNKQIRDLTGLEYFVGLTSNLNVSHNYIDNMQALYDLDANKLATQNFMQEQYNYWLKNRSYGNLASDVKKTTEDKTQVEDHIKLMKEAAQKVINLLASAATATGTAEDISKKITDTKVSIQEVLSAMNDVTDAEGNITKGYTTLLKEDIKKINDEDIFGIYFDLSNLYSIYNSEYKLTSLLTKELNYQTYEEYKTYLEQTRGTDEVTATQESAMNLLKSEIQYLSTLESSNALSMLDKELFTTVYGVDFNNKDTKTPLTDYFNKLIEKNPLSRNQIVAMLNELREISIYSEMANYCLIERMNEVDTVADYCYAKEFLQKRIEEFATDEISTATEEMILKYMEEGTTNLLYDKFKAYEDLVYDYSGENIYACKDEYQRLDALEEAYVYYDDTTLLDAVTKQVGNTLDATQTSQYQQVLTSLGGYMDTLLVQEVNILEKSEKGNLSTDGSLFLYNQLMTLSNKLINGDTSYITLPQLKVLDISYNADLDNISDITKLTSLSELNASYDYIADVTNVDWPSMKNLKRLNLAYNFISDITPILSLENLKYLNLSNNLISGELKISEEQYIKLFKKMEEFDLSGNQISDITSLLIYLDYVSNGNYSNYLANANIILNLKNQRIKMTLPDPIYLSDYPTTFDVELPKIFTQLLAIDTARTAFGETSQDGRIESEGKYVTLNTRTTGSKTGTVVVIPMSGDGSQVDTCIGEGTTATIKYVVTDRTVSNIIVLPSENVEVKQGETKQFTATVFGTNLLDKTVEWKVEGNSSANTVISETGLLTVGADETSETVKVTATSAFDKNVSTTVDVKIIKNDVPNPDEPDDSSSIDSDVIEVRLGETVTFTATYEGPDLANRDLKWNWSMEGNTSNQTTITDKGEEKIGDTKIIEKADMKIATDEKAKTIKVIATPSDDPDNVRSLTIKVIENNQTTGDIELGYKTEEEYLTEIKTKTPIEAFKTILIGNEEYNVIVKEEGKTITSGFMKTGMTVEIQDKDGNTVKDSNGNLLVYEVIVKGDVNGDGYANSVDSSIIKAHRNEIAGSQLTGANLRAGDINGDGKVNSTDSRLLLYHRAEVKGYDLNYSAE